jgi:hypothetical protein
LGTSQFSDEEPQGAPGTPASLPHTPKRVRKGANPPWGACWLSANRGVAGGSGISSRRSSGPGPGRSGGSSSHCAGGIHRISSCTCSSARAHGTAHGAGTHAGSVGHRRRARCVGGCVVLVAARCPTEQRGGRYHRGKVFVSHELTWFRGDLVLDPYPYWQSTDPCHAGGTNTSEPVANPFPSLLCRREA